MNMDSLIKYLIWITFFIIVGGSLYLMLKKIGVV